MSFAKNKKGFTMVEMLAVFTFTGMALTSIMPAVNSAKKQADVAALRNKGRGIWIAITSANNERIQLNSSPLWPRECVENKSCTDKDSCGYFTYLLSNGGDKKTIAEDIDDRVVSDLTPEQLVCEGISAGTTSIGKDNTAWVVCDVSDNSAAEMPFLFTRNVADSVIQYKSVEKSIKLNDVEPLGMKRAVWITMGGGTMDARAQYFTNKLVLSGISRESVVWTLK